MTADELRKKYGGQTEVNIKADSLREKYKKAPIFSTLEEAQQYAKENNLTGLDSGSRIPTLLNQTKTVTPANTNIVKSYAGDVVDVKDSIKKVTTNTTTDLEKAQKSGTVSKWIEYQEKTMVSLGERDEVN